MRRFFHRLSRRRRKAAPVAIKEYLPAALALRNQGDVLPAIAAEDLAVFHYGMKCFFEEGKSLARLAHANVVRVLNFFRANETAYMVMLRRAVGPAVDQNNRQRGAENGHHAGCSRAAGRGGTARQTRMRQPVGDRNDLGRTFPSRSRIRRRFRTRRLMPPPAAAAGCGRGRISLRLPDRARRFPDMQHHRKADK